MSRNIAILAGDGIGPEVMTQTVRILKAIGYRFDSNFTFHYGEIGGSAFEKFGSHFPQETKILCTQADAILVGSVGGPISESHLPKWAHCERNSILQLRKEFCFNVNLRPISLNSQLQILSPLKQSKESKPIDMVIVRELVGDIYFGKHERSISKGLRVALDEASYSENQICSVAHFAFELARSRKGKVSSVDKANVLETSRLWREVVNEVSVEYADVQLEHVLVDHCAMKMIQAPDQFDVVLASNLFGDILSDLGAAILGSLGLLPSASINKETGFGLYEPAGGSAPDIAGKNIANPIAQILSAAMMLRLSFNMTREAQVIENAVQKAIFNGYRTKDLCIGFQNSVSTEQFTNEIIRIIEKE